MYGKTVCPAGAGSLFLLKKTAFPIAFEKEMQYIYRLK